MKTFILTFCYSGKSPRAPGTAGSLASTLFWFLGAIYFSNHEISLLWQNIFWTIFLASAFVYGCIAAPSYAKKFGNLIDHQSIVLDETVGQILPLQITFALIYENYFSNFGLIFGHLFFCFVIFRFFDIVKPSFIGHYDRTLKNGFGVMFDDLLCGLITAALGVVFILLFF